MQLYFEPFADWIRQHPAWRFVRGGGLKQCDWFGPLCILVLGLVGVCFIYSAQSYFGGSFWKKQVLWLCIGCGAYGVVAAIDYRVYFQYAHWIYAASLLLLVPIAIQAVAGIDVPLVKTRFGATRWIDFGVMVFQPSEMAKVGTLVMAASALIREDFKTVAETSIVLLKVGLILLVPLLLIFLQPDLGSALVLPPMVFSLLFVSKLPMRFVVSALVCVIFGLGIVAFDIYSYQNYMKSNGLSFDHDEGAYQVRSLIPMRDFQRNRVLTWVAPDVIDPRGTGDTWNVRQSLIAVAGGGLAGKGFGEGTQAKLGYLPKTVAANDFIFAVIAEESGFVGASLVLVLFLFLIGNGIRVASIARDRLGMLLATGVSVIFLIHVFVNIGMTIGLTPITGLPLPFLSYGGSFVLSCCLQQGLVQSVYRYRTDFS